MSLLPDGWDRDVGDDAWPDALISAIKIDVGALASPRAIATLRAWRASIRGAEPQRATASRRLAQVADALSAPGGPIPTERLDTLALRSPSAASAPRGASPIPRGAPPAARGALPPSRGASQTLRGASPTPDRETDSAVRAHSPDPSPPAEHTVWAYGEPGWVPVDEAPDIDPLLAEMAGNRPPTIDLDEDERTGETADARRPAALRASTQSPPSLDFVDEPPTAANLISPRKGSITPVSRPAPPPLPPASYVGRKPSIPPGRTRPRASLIQVRALFSAVGPLCKELVPLTYERRSRRFWTHWREVSGERGVHREAAERILETARDFRTLVTELIAEVLDVDLESVRVLVERIEAEEPSVASGPRATEERARGPLVGASVRVSGLPSPDED